MRWTDPSHHYVIRRIQNGDRARQFITGLPEFDSYDNPKDHGTLQDYWQKNQVIDRPTPAYVLVEWSQDEDAVIGVLRYRYEDQAPSAPELPPSEGPYLYLSRVGIVADRQRGRLGSMLIEFFYHLVLSEMRRSGITRLVIWWKCVERTRRFVRALVDAGEIAEFGQGQSERWGRVYCLQQVVRIA